MKKLLSLLLPLLLLLSGCGSQPPQVPQLTRVGFSQLGKAHLGKLRLNRRFLAAAAQQKHQHQQGAKDFLHGLPPF